MHLPTFKKGLFEHDESFCQLLAALHADGQMSVSARALHEAHE